MLERSSGSTDNMICIHNTTAERLLCARSAALKCANDVLKRPHAFLGQRVFSKSTVGKETRHPSLFLYTDVLSSVIDWKTICHEVISGQRKRLCFFSFTRSRHLCECRSGTNLLCRDSAVHLICLSASRMSPNELTYQRYIISLNFIN